MAAPDDQGSSRKGANTLVAIAGLFTTLAAAIITSIVANQGVRDNAEAQRADQVADQRRAVYAEFISSTGAMCSSLDRYQIGTENVNDAYVAMLTQWARVKLIAPSDLTPPAQALVDYVFNDAAQPVDEKKPNGASRGCDARKYQDLSDSFLKTAQREL
jgi:hypothetical protein